MELAGCRWALNVRLSRLRCRLRRSPTPAQVLFRFALPDKRQEVGLPVASCLLTRAPIGKVKEDGSHAFVIR